MPEASIKENWLHKHIKNIAATPFGIWLLSNTLHRIDTPLLRLTKNQFSLTTLLTGLPVLLLTTTGARSGLPRQVPLVTLADRGKIILIASFFGNSRHPSWYYNLKENPQVEIPNGQQTTRYTARQAEGEERSQYWKIAEAHYPGYRLYKRRAGTREIPVMVLEPNSPDA